MKIFKCGNCGHPLFFENIVCERCQHQSGYSDTSQMMLTFDNSMAKPMISDRKGHSYKYCKNRVHEVCNWIIPFDSKSEYCNACLLNRTIPNLSDKANFEKWRKLEVAKHRLIYQLQRLALDLPSKMNVKEGLCFDFVSRQGNASLMTGHAHGVITILLAEADSVMREQMRKQLSEPYRTLIGHFRHEVGHYFWERLISTNDEILSDYRVLFGDERENYSDALQHYYANGAPENWQGSYISKYATAHSWEDWAETWAHYLHIMDMAETAHFFGLIIEPKLHSDSLSTKMESDPYSISDFEVIIQACVPLSFAVNSMNRSMGIPDIYPFVINDQVKQKMSFIHNLVCGHLNT